MRNKIGVVAYVRVSTQEQNTDLQEAEILSYAKAKGYQGVKFYRDFLGGTTDRRPEFQRLMADIRRGYISKLIVWKLDRFSRSLRSLVMALQEMTELGVTFVSLRDSIDLSTANGRLMTYLLGAFAEFEASLIKERVNAGFEVRPCCWNTLGSQSEWLTDV